MVSIAKLLIYGLVGAFAISSLVDPARAQGTVQAFGGIGSALGNLGRGTQSLLTGIGTGAAQLLNPLWTLRDLIFSPQAGVQTGTDVRQVVSTGQLVNSQDLKFETIGIQLDPNAAFTPVTTGFGGEPLGSPPNYSEAAAEHGAALAANQTLQGFSYHSRPGFGSQPVAQVMVHGESLPLSQAAISYYQDIGVSVSPASNQTVASQNSSNATSNSSASANFSAGAAQAAGYSTGSPRP